MLNPTLGGVKNVQRLVKIFGLNLDSSCTMSDKIRDKLIPIDFKGYQVLSSVIPIDLEKLIMEKGSDCDLSGNILLIDKNSKDWILFAKSNGLSSKDVETYKICYSRSYKMQKVKEIYGDMIKNLYAEKNRWRTSPSLNKMAMFLLESY